MLELARSAIPAAAHIIAAASTPPTLIRRMLMLSLDL